MFGIAPSIQLFLLQSDWVFYKEDDPREMAIVGISAAALIAIAIIASIIRRNVKHSTAGKSKFTAPRQYNFFTFRRIASNYGLSRDHAKLLEHIFRKESVSDPLRAVENQDSIDRYFKRAFKAIRKDSKTDEETQENLEKLFTLRNIIEAGPDNNEDSSSKLSAKTPAIMVIGKDSYPVKILASREQEAVVEAPRTALGSLVRVQKGAKISLSFFAKSSSGFSLDGEVIGPVQTDSGPGIQISHTGKPKPLIKRKFRRVQTDKKCEFFPINVVESGTGRKKISKLVVDNRRGFKGTIQDISAGGCALKTLSPVLAGARLKIIIEYDASYLINVVGQVIRTNRSMAGTIIHIKFIKMPRRAFNSISTLAFGFNKD